MDILDYHFNTVDIDDYPFIVYIQNAFENKITKPIITRLIDNFIDCTPKNVFMRTPIPEYFNENNIIDYKILPESYTSIKFCFKNKDDAIKFKMAWI